jgi:DNA-binding transcriptional LysR family regulator
MPAVVAELQAKAPGVLLHISENPPDLIEQLDSGQLDFLVQVVDAAPERFARERLMTEALAWVVRAGHPLCSVGSATLEHLVGVPHVVVKTRREADERQSISMRTSWEDFGAFESELAKRGLRRHVGVVAPDTFSAMTIVARSEMVALIPRRLALLSVQAGRLALIEPPYETAPVNVSLLYRKDRLAEPPFAWMRALLSDAAVGI